MACFASIARTISHAVPACLPRKEKDKARRNSMSTSDPLGFSDAAESLKRQTPASVVVWKCTSETVQCDGVWNPSSSVIIAMTKSPHCDTHAFTTAGHGLRCPRLPIDKPLTARRWRLRCAQDGSPEAGRVALRKAQQEQVPRQVEALRSCKKWLWCKADE